MKKRIRIVIGIVLLLLVIMFSVGSTSLVLQANKQNIISGLWGIVVTPHGNYEACYCPDPTHNCDCVIQEN